jgi:hypothetical protein
MSRYLFVLTAIALVLGALAVFGGDLPWGPN